MENNTPSTAKTPKKSKKPRLVAVREYGGRQSMKKAFEDVIEYRAGVLFDEWRERQDVS